MNAAKLFYQVYTGKNMMTPDVIRFYQYNNQWAIELSIGIGFEGKLIYGITVVRAMGSDAKGFKLLNKLFYSESGAIAYVKHGLKSAMRMYDMKAKIASNRKSNKRLSITARKAN